jgi:hypothetical protein
VKYRNRRLLRNSINFGKLQQTEMGAYLSKPNCEKLSEDFDGEFLRFGASSMQGWRISQEVSQNYQKK